MTTFRLPPLWMDPYPFQIEAFKALQRGVKKFLLIWPRRAGKDLTSLILGSTAYHTGLVGPGSMIYMFPEKEQGRRAIWTARPKGRTERYVDVFANIDYRNEREMKMTFRYPSVSEQRFWNQPCYLEVHDANPDSMVGGNQNVIVCSEYGLPRMAGFLDFVRPILRENNGVLILNGTTRGKNHMWHLYDKVKDRPDWHVSYLTNQTALLANGERLITEAMIQEEIAQGMDPALARQEFGNEWDTPSAGAYYVGQMMELMEKGQICRVPYDPNRKVHTGWDLGLTDPTVIWFAQENPYGGMNLIDYEAGTQKSFSYWLSKIREGKRAEYAYGFHFVPHDIMQTVDGGDAHNPYRRIDLAYQHGYEMTLIKSPPRSVSEGIGQVANVLTACFFDKDKCDGGVEALKHYRSKETKYHFSDGTQLYDLKPFHDQYSDPADAFRILTLGFNKYVKPLSGYQGKKKVGGFIL